MPDAATLSASDQTGEPDLTSQYEADQQQQSASAEPDLTAQYEAQQARPAEPAMTRAQADAEISNLGQRGVRPVQMPQEPQFSGFSNAELEAGRRAASRQPIAQIPAPAPKLSLRGTNLEAAGTDGLFSSEDVLSPEQAERLRRGQTMPFDVAAGTADVIEGEQRFRHTLDPLYVGNPNPERFAAGTEAISGAMELGTPSFGRALVNQPIKTLAGVVAGTATGDVAGKTVQHFGGSPEAQEFAKTLGFFAPSLLATISGVRAGKLPVEGGKGAGFEAFGGRVKAAVGENPEQFSAGVQVGKTAVGINIPRSGKTMPPGVSEKVPISPNDLPGPRTELRTQSIQTSPSTTMDVVTPVQRNITPGEVTAAKSGAMESLRVMAKAKAAESQAKQMASGKPATPAPQPNPGQEFGRALSAKQLQHIGRGIASIPLEQRGQFADEAHNKLTQWIMDNGGKVVIDHHVHLAKDRNEAEQIAADVLNNAVSNADAESEQQTSSPEAQPAAPQARTASAAAPEMERFLQASRPAPAASEAPAAAQPQAEPDLVPLHEESQAQASMFGETEAQQPNFAYRVRDVGETGLRPNAHHAEAGLDRDQIEGYLSTRNPGTPQELVRVDLNQLEPHEYSIENKNGYQWVKFKTPVPEAFIEKAPPREQPSPRAMITARGVPAKGEVSRMPVSQLVIDPKRFQYKLNVNEHGVTNLLSGRRWNDELAGIISIWRDPQDGRVYVVNGHHRAQLAKENRVPDVLVRHLNVDTAEAARARGALQNIAEGRGTSVDAAKFFRETGITPEKLDEYGISMGEATAAKGLALAKLDPSIFEKVATGKISEGRGVAIGEATGDPAQQEAIVKLLDKREGQGKTITDATVAELSRFVANSGNRTVQQGGLFGPNEQIHSLALEKAEISAYIKNQLSKERRLFGSVSSETKAATLASVEGQTVKAERNRLIAESAAQAAEAYDKLSAYAGPVNDILETAAKELVSGKHKPEEVKKAATIAAREEIQKALSQGSGSGVEGLQGGAEGGAGPETQAAGSPAVRRNGEAGFARMDLPGTLAGAALRRLLEPSEETKAARSVDDRLFELEKQYEADVLRAASLLRSVSTTTEDQEAIYHHLEDPDAPLSPQQRQFLDNYIEPLTEASSEMRAKLAGSGMPIAEEAPGYVHRIVQSRPSPLSRLTQAKKAGGKGNMLSKSASSLKQRSMFAAVSENGERVVVHRGDGKLTGFRDGEPFELANDKPGLKPGKAFFDSDGTEWTLEQATTREIEEHTNLRYYKNALATAIVDYLQLRRAERANDALESLKSDPQFQEMAFHEEGGLPPDGWRPTTLPQFRGWWFEPRTAEVLERYSRELTAEPYSVLDRIGNFMTASLLLNPARHVFNIGNHWLVERGASGNFNPFRYPKAYQAGMRAIHAVMTRNDDFLFALDHGAPMMSHRQDLQQFHQKLYELLLDHLEQDHSAREKIAQFFGLEPQGFRDTGPLSKASRASGLRFLNNLRKLGQRAMWMSNDVLILQSSYEKMLRDPELTFKEAMAQTVKHIPDYRLPDRVLDSKALATLMGNPLLTIFSRYHYGVWKSYGEMLRESFSPDSTMQERARGIDHMLMLAVVTFLLYELWDKALKAITHDPNARMVRSGASAVPAAIAQVMQGTKEPSDLITASLTPNPLLKTTAELAFNRNTYTGAHIFDPHDSGEQILADIGMHFAGALGPVEQYRNTKYRENPARDFAYSQVGVTFPKYESRSQAVNLMHDLLRESMPPLSPQAQRDLDARRERIASGQMTVAEAKRQAKLKAEGELRYYAPFLRFSDMKRVYEVATPEEKKVLKPMMELKALHLFRRDPLEAQREGAFEIFKTDQTDQPASEKER